MRDFNLICVGELMIHLWISIDTMIKKTPHKRSERKHTPMAGDCQRKRRPVCIRRWTDAQNTVILSIVHCCVLFDCRFRFNRCIMFESKTFIFLLIQNTENKIFSLVKWELSFFVQYTWTFFFLLITSGSRPGNAYLSPFLSKVVRFSFRLR